MPIGRCCGAERRCSWKATGPEALDEQCQLHRPAGIAARKGDAPAAAWDPTPARHLLMRPEPGTSCTLKRLSASDACTGLWTGSARAGWPGRRRGRREYQRLRASPLPSARRRRSEAVLVEVDVALRVARQTCEGIDGAGGQGAACVGGGAAQASPTGISAQRNAQEPLIVYISASSIEA